jgi:hypothetical protein
MSAAGLDQKCALSYELLLRGSSFESMYSRPSGPIAVTCVTYSPDFAQ